VLDHVGEPCQLAALLMRMTLFVLAGAVAGCAATFFYGLWRFQNGWGELTMQELAIRLLGVGAVAGAFLGILLARTTASPVDRPIRFIVVGTIVGVLGGLVYGFRLDICEAPLGDPPGPPAGDPLVCGAASLLGFSPWHLFAVIALYGVLAGSASGLVGLAIERLTRRH
jgi:hypothetical protein